MQVLRPPADPQEVSGRAQGTHLKQASPWSWTILRGNLAWGMPVSQLRGQETTNGLHCFRSQNQRPQYESPYEAQMPCPPPGQTDEEMEHEEPKLNLQVRPLSPSERGRRTVCGGGGGGGMGGGQLAWESTPGPVLRPWESHFLPGGPHLSGTKMGGWRTW